VIGFENPSNSIQIKYESDSNEHNESGLQNENRKKKEFQ
jgi:hypothetical protein